MENIKTFVKDIHIRRNLVWFINKAFFSLAILITIYILGLIFDRLFYMTPLERKFFLFILFLSLVPFLFGKPNLSSTLEFIEKKIRKLKGRLFLIMEPYPSAFDSKTYRKRAMEECISILKKEHAQNLTPIEIDFKYLKPFTIILLTFFLTSFFTKGIRLNPLPEKPILVYAKEKIKENQNFLVKAKSNRLRKLYLLSNKKIKRMLPLGNGEFAIMTKLKASSNIQVGYRTWKSDEKRIEVIPTLYPDKIILQYNFPDYLRSKPFSDTVYKVRGNILIQALEGTRIDFHGVTNLPLGSIKSSIRQKSIGGKIFSGSFIVQEKCKVNVELVDSSLFCSYNFKFFIDPIEDEPPRIEFIYPQEEYKLDELMEVPVILQAEDDYALLSSDLVYGKKKASLSVPRETKFFLDSLILDLGNLMPGEVIELKGIATDCAGNTTISAPILVYVPTLEEILNEYKNLSDTLKEKTVSFGETEKEMTKKIENFLHKNKLGMEHQKEIRQTLEEQKQLIEGMEKLAEISEKIRSPEFSEEIRRIQELLNNSQVREFLNNLNKLLENSNISSEELRNINKNQKELLETLKLFEKSLEYLKKLLELNEFSERANEIFQKQKEINSSKVQEILSEQQKDLQAKLEKLTRDMEKSSNNKISEIASNFKKTETTKTMEDLANSLKKGEFDQKRAQEIEDNLRNLNMSLNAIRQSIRGQKAEKALKEKGWELGFVLRTHNNIIEMKPSLEKGLIEQGLLEALTKIEKELQKLFLETLAFSPEVFNDIKRAKEKMKDLSLELTHKEVLKTSMERVNDLLIQAILKLFSSPPPNSQSLANSINQIIQQQNSIMQGIGKSLPMEIPSQTPGGDLKSLSEKQKQLADELSEMGKAFNPISAEMKAMAEDLARGEIDKRLLERQKKVLDRLLEAEKAIREGEVSRRRKSEPGIFVSPGKISLPVDLGEEKKKLRELLEKRMEEPYPRQYKKEIEEYFRKLIE